MYIELTTVTKNGIIEKIYQLLIDILGCQMVVVSVKPPGMSGLSRGSFYVIETPDGRTLTKEIDYGIIDDEYSHDQILMNAIGKKIKSNSPAIFGEKYHCWRNDKYIGVATFTDDENIGPSFLNKKINDTNEESFEVYRPKKWILVN